MTALTSPLVREVNQGGADYRGTLATVTSRQRTYFQASGLTPVTVHAGLSNQITRRYQESRLTALAGVAGHEKLRPPLSRT
jgi:hypothetical protein